MRREGYTTQGDAGEPVGPPRAVIASSVWIPRTGWGATFMTGRGAPAVACAALPVLTTIDPLWSGGASMTSDLPAGHFVHRVARGYTPRFFWSISP